MGSCCHHPCPCTSFACTVFALILPAQAHGDPCSIQGVSLRSCCHWHTVEKHHPGGVTQYTREPSNVGSGCASTHHSFGTSLQGSEGTATAPQCSGRPFLLCPLNQLGKSSARETQPLSICLPGQADLMIWFWHCAHDFQFKAVTSR